MANTNKPFGLRPHSSLNGGPWTGNVRTFLAPTGETSNIFVGDLVRIAGTEGVVYPDDMPVPTAILATTGDVCVGVVVGVSADPDALGRLYRKASTAQYLLVDTDPNTIFAIQGDADTYDAADIGLNAIVTFTAGNTTSGSSNFVLDQNAVSTSTGTNADVKLLASAPIVGNDLTGGYPILLVKILNHQYANSAIGA